MKKKLDAEEIAIGRTCRQESPFVTWLRAELRRKRKRPLAGDRQPTESHLRDLGIAD